MLAIDAGAAPSATHAPLHAGPPDDPLLSSLVTLARLHGRPATAESFAAGLPLGGRPLPPDLLVRAAEAGGLSARLVRRTLHELPESVLPAVLLITPRDACILVRRDGQGNAVVLTAASGFGEETLALTQLEAVYAGYALLARPAHRFDSRIEDEAVPDRRGWLRGAVLRAWPIYTEVMVASVLVNVLGLVFPLFTMNVYDRVVPNHALDTLWALAIGALVVVGFELVIRTLRAYLVDVAGRKIDVMLSASIHQRVMGVTMKDRPQSVGGFLSGLTEFESFREFLTSATITTLVDLPFALLFIAALFWIGGPIAWICVVAIPIVLLASLIVQAAMAGVVERSMKLSAQRQAGLVESLVGLETIKVTNAQGLMQQRWEQTVAEIARLGLRSRLLSSGSVNFASFVQQVAGIAVVVYGVLLIGDDRLTLGGLIACSILCGRALAPLGQLAGLITRFNQSRSALRSADRLMQLQVERPEGRVFVSRPRLQGEIEFRGVTFAYPGQQGAALQDVSFRIGAGERVAIIGRTGSGKTTIEKLVLGLFEPASGAVLVDGTDLRQIDPAALRRDIGHVPQDVTLFFGTVRSNITLGAPHADDAAILRASRIGGVDAFVDGSPSGFDLQVGERGERLSGGQRQAIAIARAELTRPPVLLLDEPSSALDNGSEEQFKARLAAELGGRTLVLITHRSSLLSLVDRLIVVDHGRVVADGPKEAVLTALATGKVNVDAR
jgi:ATP-binding cassette subfamily C protein LapB